MSRCADGVSVGRELAERGNVDVEICVLEDRFLIHSLDNYVLHWQTDNAAVSLATGELCVSTSPTASCGRNDDCLLLTANYLA